MKHLVKAACAAIAFIFIVAGCSKFEDGPAFSLLTKKARATGHWKMEKYTLNDADITSVFIAANGEGWKLNIERDGTYSVSGNFPDSGTWSFGEDKDDLFFSSNTAGASLQVWRILRLKNKEMWLRQTQPNGDMIKMYLKR